MTERKENGITLTVTGAMVVAFLGAMWFAAEAAASLKVVTESAGQTEDRVRALEIQASGFSADLRNIQSGVDRIEASLADMKKESRP